jgi:hypothetical protein
MSIPNINIASLVNAYITTKLKEPAKVSIVVMPEGQKLGETSTGRGQSLIDVSMGGNKAFNRMVLQFFPETLSDPKSVDYASFEAPGSASPLYQWVKSGARPLSFTAIFYRESVDDIPAGTKETRYNVDINKRVAWLRRFMYPDYKDDGTSTPPSRLLLCFPKTFISVLGGSVFPCIMTKCDVEWKEWFIDGTPRLATVNLEFAEYCQFSDGIGWPRQFEFENYLR